MYILGEIIESNLSHIPPNPLTMRRSYTAEYRENIAGILRKGVIKR